MNGYTVLLKKYIIKYEENKKNKILIDACSYLIYIHPRESVCCVCLNE